jgi:Na+-driven multidrug efflux pump
MNVSMAIMIVLKLPTENTRVRFSRPLLRFRNVRVCLAVGLSLILSFSFYLYLFFVSYYLYNHFSHHEE